jgi:hypothetical protein
MTATHISILLFVCHQSFLEGFLFHIIVVLSWRVQMPDVAFHREIRVVEEAIAWFATDLPSRIVSVRIVFELLIRPHESPAVPWSVLSGVVDQHSWVHVLRDPLFEVL